jgi:hypothetical protein
MIVEGLEPRVWIRKNAFPAPAFVPDKRPESAALPHPCPEKPFQIKWEQAAVVQRAVLDLQLWYRLFFLRSIAQLFTEIYMNCFVSL